MAKEDRVKSNDSGVVSVIFGILSIVSILFTTFALLAPIAGLIFAVVALIFGIVQMKNNKNSWATAGIILSIIAILLNVVVFLLEFQLLSQMANQAAPLIEQARAQQELLSQYSSQYA